MNQPNPWILLIGGFALFNVGGIVYGAKAPEWARLGGLLACIAMGIACIAIAMSRQFRKKPAPPPRRPSRRSAQPRPQAAPPRTGDAGDPG
ncbi:hypothetical protein [Polyangium aurulentum]|uniref:hypothetical protein n=1 Tax=Polyangium aurulentum TaxID=2567896 RepID=UPI00146AAFB5|nr:hypothetical protein [Polyangium aurulentum]UQA60335.1 hypothetical protein E8A73_007635 [Polyangium aurulentum]